MAQQAENRSIDEAVELLKDNGVEGLAEAVTVLLNSAMVSEGSEEGYMAELVKMPGCCWKTTARSVLRRVPI